MNTNIIESCKSNVLQEDLNFIADRNLPFEKLKNSTIFITGATGLIGSQLVRGFACCNRRKNLNMKIILFVRNEVKAQKLYGDLLEREDICLVKGDILDNPESYVAEDERIDYIIHAASVTTSKTMITRPVDVIDVSFCGSRNMLELARIHKVKGFVYISSMEMYGQFSEDGKYIKEDDLGFLDVLDIRSNYPESKRMCENMCMAYMKQFDIPVYIARLAQTFGAGILPGENRVFAQFARSAMNGENIVLHTRGLSEGNYCYTRDTVIAIMTIILKGERGNAYNVVNESAHTTIAGMAQLVAEKIADSRIKVEFDIPDENIYGYAKDTKMKLSSEKLESLGWKPSVNIEEAYKRMIEYMEESL